MAKESRAKAAMGGKKPSGKSKSKKHGKVHKMHISRGASGGFSVEHEAPPSDAGSMPGGGSEGPHVLPDRASMQQHLQEHMGDQPPVQAAAPPAAAPAAAAPAAAPPAGL